MFELTYARCVLATPGELDRHPWSKYVLDTVQAQMYRVPADRRLGEDEDSFDVVVAGRLVGSGYTKHDAANAARYRLMDESRTAALAAFQEV